MVVSAMGVPVCIITDTRAFGGTEVHTLSLIEALVGRGHTIQLVSCTFHCYDEPVAKMPWRDKVTITHAAGQTNDAAPEAIERWASLLATVTAEVVVVPKGDYRSGSVEFFELCRRRFRRVCAIEHLEAEALPPVHVRKLMGVIPLGLGLWWYRRTKDRRRAAAAVHRIVAVSAAVKNRLAGDWGIPAGKMVVVRNGVRWDQFTFDAGLRQSFRSAQALEPDVFVFGMLTRLVPAKAVDVAIRSVAALLTRQPTRQFLLVIAGEGEDRAALDALVRELGVGGHVRFVGHADSRTALSAFDVILFSSIREGLPLALLEGMASGAVPIVTAISGMPEAVSHPDLGWVVPPNHPEAMAEAMAAAMATSDERWQAMRHAVVRHVSREFDLESSRRRLCEALGL